MKHTYLYPLEDGELPLWRMARMGAADLFGSPEEEPPSATWEHYITLGDALGDAREELHKRLESRDRVCIGRHYVIPGSLCEVAQSHEREADQVVRYVTEQLWDAPVFDRTLFANVWDKLKRTDGRDGSDGWADSICLFLGTHRGRRVIPVWM